jgi:hypothetical protein
MEHIEYRFGTGTKQYSTSATFTEAVFCHVYGRFPFDALRCHAAPSKPPAASSAPTITAVDVRPLGRKGAEVATGGMLCSSTSFGSLPQRGIHFVDSTPHIC